MRQRNEQHELVKQLTDEFPVKQDNFPTGGYDFVDREYRVSFFDKSLRDNVTRMNAPQANDPHVDLNDIIEKLDALETEMSTMAETRRQLTVTYIPDEEKIKTETARHIKASMFSLMSEILPAIGLAISFFAILLSALSFSKHDYILSVIYACLFLASYYPTYLTFKIRSDVRRKTKNA
ncbi:hypothetical protein J7481_12940 [Labrenzia sp. R4_2]|uniref:hypothetical protein n=1 Tax=Labrenzia sp. R4_2 TaxID=2821107 RepID=UPI001ADC3A32|nr:hypothetical protein [Labrenzia sp. R4_2]MBO9420401.1 hypothetical protein [Labrenzia sp. R4_2]